MKILVVVLSGLFLVLQYKLWFQESGLSEATRLRQAISAQTKENNQLTQQNLALNAEVKALKSGQEAVEERARNDLGLVKPNEVFYQVVSK